MNEILSLQVKIQEISREYDCELNHVRELEEKLLNLQRKKCELKDETDDLLQQIQVFLEIHSPHRTPSITQKSI
jgi:hypothetical protein